MTKADLRRNLRSQLESFSFQDLISRSGDLSAHFHAWAAVFHDPRFFKKTLVSYYPFGNEPQVQVEPADPAHAQDTAYQVAYLRIDDWNRRGMQAHFARRDLPDQWEEFTVPGTENRIWQPLPSQPLCPTESIAAVLVPALGFSKTGARLGRGAGFYDRYLAQVPHALRIGIAFELQVVDSIPTDAHDLPVDIILTESRMIETIRFSEWKKHGKIKRE